MIVLKEIDSLLAGNVSDKKSDKLVALIRTDAAFENYFFSKVKKINWFSFLKNADCFKPERVPHEIPEWNVCPYLERVSEQINIPRNKKYINELLQIIKNVSNHKDAHGQHIDNYGTWWSFVKILLNIPKERIPLEVIDLIPIWLDSGFDVSLVGKDIGLKLLPKFLSGDPSSEDITKAERIVDYITNVKSVKLSEERARIYNKEEEYKLVIDSYWVNDIFEKHSRDIGEKCTNRVVYSLGDKIRTLLKKDESLIPFEAGDKAYLLALSSVDVKYSVKVFDMGEKSGSDIYEYVFMKKKLEGTPLKEITMDETTLNNFSSNVFDNLTKDVLFKSIETKELKRDIYRLYRNFHDEETHASFYDESRTHLTDPT